MCGLPVLIFDYGPVFVTLVVMTDINQSDLAVAILPLAGGAVDALFRLSNKPEALCMGLCKRLAVRMRATCSEVFKTRRCIRKVECSYKKVSLIVTT